MTETSDRMLTVAEAAAELHVKPVTVQRWLRAGTLRGTKMPSDRAGWRIPATEVARLLGREG